MSLCDLCVHVCDYVCKYVCVCVCDSVCVYDLYVYVYVHEGICVGAGMWSYRSILSATPQALSILLFETDLS